MCSKQGSLLPKFDGSTDVIEELLILESKMMTFLKVLIHLLRYVKVEEYFNAFTFFTKPRSFASSAYNSLSF